MTKETAKEKQIILLELVLQDHSLQVRHHSQVTKRCKMFVIRLTSWFRKVGVFTYCVNCFAIWPRNWIDLDILDKKRDIIVTTIPMVDFPAFVGDLNSIISNMQAHSQKIFIPIAISASPISPTTDFVVVFRESSSVRSLPVKDFFNPKMSVLELSKKFSHKV